MFGIFFLAIVGAPLFAAFLFMKFISKRYKIMLLRFFVKAKHSWYDYHFMTNLSMGVFASSIVALVVSNGIYTIVAYSFVAIISFIAMIDYNYKK